VKLGDYDVYRTIGERDVLDFAFQKLNIGKTAFARPLPRIRSRLGSWGHTLMKQFPDLGTCPALKTVMSRSK
jgi:hypothetical protein